MNGHRMNVEARRQSRAMVLLVAGILPIGCANSQAPWPQFGGPDRNFMVTAPPLADHWPEQGPPVLWSRDLGDGYATIVSDGDALYTMYRLGPDEITVALDADTGVTRWEHKNPAPPTPLMEQFGPGPHASPVLAGSRLFTIGTNAVLHCFDKRTGKVLWRHDLPAEFKAPIPGRGFACSPIAFEDLLILPVDRERPDPQGGQAADEEAKADDDVARQQSLMAFDQKTGDVAWSRHDYPVSYASPVLIRHADQTQLVVLLERELIGLNPRDGELLWHEPFEPEGTNLASPLWTGDDLLFCSSAYDSGSRTIKLTRDGNATVPTQLWYSRKMRIHHANAVRIGDYVYGSSGDFGPAFFMGLNIHTGEVAWRERGFAKATCLLADGKLILLDEDGQLALATATPQGFTVHSKCKIAERYAWAAPTLVGSTLYVRDRKKIMALDLG